MTKREESSSPEEVSRKGREPRVIANLDIASDTTSSSGGSRDVSPVPPEEEKTKVTKKEAPDSKQEASSKPDDDDAANCILSVLEQDETSTQEIIDEIDTLMTEEGMDEDLGEGEEDPATDDDDGEDLDLAPEDEDDPLTSEDEEEDFAAEEEEPMDIMDSIDQELAK